ncbi:type II secretion system F family protein [Methylonatrum kenyense]|uniref:type II secretion system F family protein n=1 Tax=Methylonatrum kenyense TaxID=455253 RepID=UPI0020BEC39E|nr:type II secretion system F family protein [Methylonatrum kenyense]MCK8515209.1 type II secretion system F family protein [Methylonatrum kenyense]
MMLLAAGLLLLACAALLLVARGQVARDEAVARRFRILAGFGPGAGGETGGGLERLLGGKARRSKRRQRQGATLEERVRTQRLLMAPLLAVALSAFGLLRGESMDQLLILGMIGGILGYMLPVWIGRLREVRHRQRMDAQVPMLIHLMIMTFDAGLTVERSLASVRRDSRRLVPDIADELDQLFARLDHGEDVVDALEMMDESVNVDSFSDLVSVLRQILQQGGEARRSLLSLADILEIRRRQQLQERISKMAGKMTVVMVLFFFPALFILLAGPAFIAVVGSLGDLSG